ncbi:hypothetical protein M407DRAFT_163861 [Tulasnella calospora MUT 4182]|uniref:Uncharacterized protein n=1 Tax=Tulasnella calospora MUT 4182 TaxID=1051891 RepID=A0A0C3K9B2_9AGAM|nr:hypothetical protein M407DRAFT_163861 [Tulasnella calospora MUT 4182]
MFSTAADNRLSSPSRSSRGNATYRNAEDNGFEITSKIFTNCRTQLSLPSFTFKPAKTPRHPLVT